MAAVKMTIMGFENYLSSTDAVSLFHDISLPEGLDPDIVKDTILLRCAEFEVYYSDPYYMKAVTEHWFLKKYHTFEEWLRGISAVYNPTENYDRVEEWTDTDAKMRASTRTDDSQIADQTDSNGSGSTSTAVTTDTSSDYLPDTQTSSSSGATSSTNSTGHNTSAVNDSENVTATHSGHVHGNIGIKTSSEILSEFLKISEWNIYDHIADAYKNEFCVAVYV